MANTSAYTSFDEILGDLWAGISGQKQAQNVQRDLRDTAITSAFKQYSENGINPLLAVEGGAQLPSASAVATEGAPHIGESISGIINSASKLLNANDNTHNREVRNYVYNQAGKLVSSAVETFRKSSKNLS